MKRNAATCLFRYARARAVPFARMAGAGLAAACIIAAGLMTALPQSAGAQEQTQEQTQEQKQRAAPPATLPDSAKSARNKSASAESGLPDAEDIPLAYLEEMNEIYQDCYASDFLFTWIDCRCQAMRYLEERIALGPDMSRSYLLNRLSGDCPNTVGAAGNAYQSCIEWRMQSNHVGYEDFCRCVAQHTAKAYEQIRVVNSINIIEMKKRAYARCGIAKEFARQRRLRALE